MTPWQYEVQLINEKTGEHRSVIVELTDEQQRDVFRNLDMGATGPELPMTYAMQRAAECAEPGFVPQLEGMICLMPKRAIIWH